mmetsp:Transcript_12375/g.28921  ORF Transcript_12375/g.28921 Transcript_12375/m.28921 type:complete len:215 (+) Transcript_12375:63-707(+)
MLFADKAALTNRARQRMIEIRERELNLYARNSRVIATKATLLCGIANAGLLYVKQPYYQLASPFIKVVYPLVLTLLLGFSMLSLMNFNLISMLGPGLALRGPDGSVHVAIEYIALEYKTASFFFLMAVLCLHLVVLAYAWAGRLLIVTRLMLTALTIYSLYAIFHTSLLTAQQFHISQVLARARARERARCSSTEARRTAGAGRIPSTRMHAHS